MISKLAENAPTLTELEKYALYDQFLHNLIAARINVGSSELELIQDAFKDAVGIKL